MQSIKINLVVACDACDLECKQETTEKHTGNLDAIINKHLQQLMKLGDIHPCGNTKMLCARCYGAFDRWTVVHKARVIEENQIQLAQVELRQFCDCLPPKHAKPNLLECSKCHKPFHVKQDNVKSSVEA